MTETIKPTVGRVLWYYPREGDQGASPPPGQPLAAIIATVWTDTCINIAYFDANGVPWNKQSVLLIQGDTVPAEGGYAVWMPFQKGQAKAQVASELTSQIADDGKAMAKFIMPGGSVVKVGGIPVRLDHPCVALTHPDNLNMVLGELRDGQACKT